MGRLLVCGLVWLVAAMGACAGADDPIAYGKYIGDHLIFSVDGITEVHDITVTGMKCRVPFPDFQELSICKHSAPGLLVGPYKVRDGEFKASTNELTIRGTFSEDGQVASGTWSFERVCLEGSVCSASGTWTSAFDHAEVPVADVVTEDTDEGQDIGPEDDVFEFDGVIPPAPEGALPHQAAANAYLNMIRSWVKVDPALQNVNLNQAAQAHADYVSFHADKYQQSDWSPHEQNPEWEEGFTGKKLGARCAEAGYGGCNWEVMTWISSPEGAIDGWIDTLYHRIPLLHPNTSEFGYGMALEGSPCDVMDGSYGSATLPGPAMWPLPSAKGVAVSWPGYESPQPPLPATEAYPSGPIISLTFRREISKELFAAELLDSGGNPVPAQVQSPQNDDWLKDTDTWAIYAYSPLESQMTYTVRFEGKVGGQPYEESWSFTTQ